MKTKTPSIWFGVVAIIWMIGVYATFGEPPYVFLNALFGLESHEWLWMTVDLFVWLGVGFWFAVGGLRCGKSVGQAFGIVAVGVFVYFAWRLLHPPYVVDAA